MVLAKTIGKIERHDKHHLLGKRGSSQPLYVPIRFGVQDDTWQVELLREFQHPLLANRCRAYPQLLSLAFCPGLAQHDTRLDGLSEADFVGEDDALRQRR